MHLIQLLLPLYNNHKQFFSSEIFSSIRLQLTEKYGGITTYTRSPATGLWKETNEKTVRDEIVIYEVMTKAIDKNWWDDYKKKLEKTFEQEEIIIRVMPMELL